MTKHHLLSLVTAFLVLPMSSLYSQTYYSLELERHAKNGNSSAQYSLARCFDFGLGTEHNPEKAFFWYKMAEENGNLYAKYTLGKIYENGFLLQKTRNINDSTIQMRIVKYPGVEKDIAKAISYYESAAASDDFAEVQYHLAEMFYEGKIIKKDYDKAFIYLRRVACNPSLDKNKKGIAMNRLANCYRYGRGTDMDMQQCDYWREQAALNGYQDAQDLTGVGVYGQLYLEDGSKYSPTEMFHVCTFYKKSEEKNDTIHTNVILLKPEEKGYFSLPAKYTGELLVMEVSEEFLPIEFIGTQNMRLTLIKNK